jgi:hypothetical protein
VDVVFALMSRVLLRWGEFSSRVVKVWYPSVGVLLNYCFKNYIPSGCYFVVDLVTYRIKGNCHSHTYENEIPHTSPPQAKTVDL